MTDSRARHLWKGFKDRRRPHPNPRGRRVLMVLILLGVIAGFALLVWLIAELRVLMDKSRAPTQQDLERAALAFKVLALVMSGSLLGVATWIGHFAWRIQREEVYPPPGSRHLRVRRVLRGQEARRAAYLFYSLAGLLVAAGLAITPMAFRIMAQLRL